jgi:hypothetical protein
MGSRTVVVDVSRLDVDGIDPNAKVFAQYGELNFSPPTTVKCAWKEGLPGRLSDPATVLFGGSTQRCVIEPALLNLLCDHSPQVHSFEVTSHRVNHRIKPELD